MDFLHASRLVLLVTETVSRLPWETFREEKPIVLPPLPPGERQGGIVAQAAAQPQVVVNVNAPGVQAQQEEEYCPACSSGHHANAIIGFTKGMVERAKELPDDAPLPEGVGGTVPLIAKELREMIGHVQRVPEHYPHLTDDATAVAQAALPVAAKLRWVSNCGEARALHQAAEDLHMRAYQMALKKGLAPNGGTAPASASQAMPSG